jgi:hypothetical protein
MAKFGRQRCCIRVPLELKVAAVACANLVHACCIKMAAAILTGSCRMYKGSVPLT